MTQRTRDYVVCRRLRRWWQAPWCIVEKHTINEWVGQHVTTRPLGENRLDLFFWRKSSAEAVAHHLWNASHHGHDDGWWDCVSIPEHNDRIAASLDRQDRAYATPAADFGAFPAHTDPVRHTLEAARVTRGLPPAPQPRDPAAPYRGNRRLRLD